MVDAPTVKGALSRLGLHHPTAKTLIVHHSETTDVPTAKLWAVLEDVDQWSRWSKPIHERARWLEKRTFEFGARFEQVRHKGFPIGRQVTVETVREVNPGSSVAWWGGEGGLTSCRIWLFETQPDGSTRVSSTEVYQSFLVMIAKPVLRKRWNRLNKLSVDGLIERAKRAQ
jgi:hypothetical protein